MIDASAAAFNLANMLALLGAIFFVATLLMRTIVPLRVAAIISNVFFIVGVLANSITTHPVLSVVAHQQYPPLPDAQTR